MTVSLEKRLIPVFGRLNLFQFNRGGYTGLILGEVDARILGKGISKYRLMGEARFNRTNTAWFCDDCGEQVFDLGSGCNSCLKVIGA